MIWRNVIAWLLIAAAFGEYFFSAPLLFQSLARNHGGVERPADFGDIDLIVSWLVRPVYLIGWAGVTEYLSRIAQALKQAPSSKAE